MRYVEATALWWISIITSVMIIFIVYIITSAGLDGIIDGVRFDDGLGDPSSRQNTVVNRISDMFNLAPLLLIAMLIIYGLVRLLKTESTSRYFQEGMQGV
jgi:hypothetical protein